MDKDKAREAAVDASGLINTTSRLVYRDGFDAGWDARGAVECEWVQGLDRLFDIYYFDTACKQEFFERALPGESAPAYCLGCDGRVKVI